jgi:acyl-CoA thioesterase-1
MFTDCAMKKKVHSLTFLFLIPFLPLGAQNLLFQTDLVFADDSAENSTEKVVLFLGDSLTAGYGVEPEHSFPSLLARRIEAQKKNFKVVNAGISGDTTAGGLRRLDWLLRQPVDILVLALGANDGLRGLPLDESENNLKKIISRSRERYPEIRILLAGMLIPPNMGEKYSARFKEIFPRLAEEERVELIPFLLEGVAAQTDLNLADGIHPNEQGYKKVADTVWNVLLPVLKTVETNL